MDFTKASMEMITSAIYTAVTRKCRAVSVGTLEIDGKVIKLTLVAEPPVYLRTEIAGDDENETVILSKDMASMKVETSIVKMLRKEMCI